MFTMHSRFMAVLLDAVRIGHRIEPDEPFETNKQ